MPRRYQQGARVQVDEHRTPPAVLKVQRRKVKRSSYGKRTVLRYPELRIPSAWLFTAGLNAGDIVRVASPRPGTLVVILKRAAEPGDPDGPPSRAERAGGE